MTTPNPAGLADVTAGEGVLAGGLAAGLAQAALNGASPSSTVSSNARRPQVIMGSRYR
ncbi:MAG TPA: hypothetical protein VMA72_01830 [Streptosporangiaceae bacterium]|nr:hypothetical protein [Streptosporangiaceae bacterium]